ncbi:AAA family ATPase [Blastopirellula marina]|uniref:Magnesium chelatase n=1 Tax=Blastopirellula marina TaxID=124 RepID=A0A2S8G0Z8_9BACT|nr:MoxR family ATPase [Blastopirellula marina]PQO38113.1 magnesium chelatase [Blastopirellula marina]PTL44769.1 MoxR family ATPase [Blastopirellula marina]
MDVAATIKKILGNVEKVILGKRQQVVFSLVAWLSEGHVLMEDVPGVAKTMLARALAKSVGCTLKRIQCTPDLLPTDVTGTSIFNQKTSEFEFRQGPVFTNILLADEINRTTPRTQAALLEAMAESRVTIDGVTHDLDPPFLVLATQNPVDHEGTFPLPEAQLDRFLMKFSLGYPNMEDELKMLSASRKQHPLETIGPVVTKEELLACQKATRSVKIHEKVQRYIVELVHATRRHDQLMLGASPRASLALFRTSQSLAAILGRNYVLPDDVKRVLTPVMGHRMILRPESRLRKVTSQDILDDILQEVPVPMIDEAPV